MTLDRGGLSTSTDANGNYTFSGLQPAIYAVAPELSCFQFSPEIRTAKVGPSTNNVDFQAVPDAYAIRGRIIAGGYGLSNVTVTAGAYAATTDANGNWSVDWRV